MILMESSLFRKREGKVGLLLKLIVSSTQNKRMATIPQSNGIVAIQCETVALV